MPSQNKTRVGMHSWNQHVAEILFSAMHYILAETSVWKARVARKKKTASLGNRQFTAKDHSNQSLMCNSYFKSNDVRAGLQLPTQYFTLTDSLISSWVECLCKTWRAGMDSWNKPVQQIFFRLCITFWEHGQLKGWPRQKLAETSQWQARVAWIEGGQQILGTDNSRRKIILILIHDWFATPTSNLTMFELDYNSQLNISPLRTLWSLHELNVFAKHGEQEWIPEINMSNKSFFGSALHFLGTWTAERLAAPKT